MGYVDDWREAEVCEVNSKGSHGLYVCGARASPHRVTGPDQDLT